MKIVRATLGVCALAAGLAACDAPAVVGPAAPRFDSSRTGLAASADTTSTPAAERGGPFTVGSGN